MEIEKAYDFLEGNTPPAINKANVLLEITEGVRKDYLLFNEGQVFIKVFRSTRPTDLLKLSWIFMKILEHFLQG